MVATLKDLGEKEIIRTLIKPLLNPGNSLFLAGDDCGVIQVSDDKCVCLSTDRVPADLISYKLGLLSYDQLGYYLGVLNISDVIASGSKPAGLLLNLAFDSDFPVDSFQSIVEGAKRACDDYDCHIIGGDLSHSEEMSISATSIGIGDINKILYRKGAKAGDFIYCSSFIGLTSTAFSYYLRAKPKGFTLSEKEEQLLATQFQKPVAKYKLSQLLIQSGHQVTAMDNTDGAGQSYQELAEINSLRFELDLKKLPIHEVTYKVAKFLDESPESIALGGGADFQLLGTIDSSFVGSFSNELINEGLTVIGVCMTGSGLFLNDGAQTTEYTNPGWNYFSR